MPTILKVQKEEISWQLGGVNINAGTQANTRLKENLGELASSFAPMSVTVQGYQWSAPDTGWTPLSQASPAQADLINVLLNNLREAVHSRLQQQPKLAERILSLPSDLGKYIYFRGTGESTQLLVAGWGFANSRRQVTSIGRVKKDIRNNVDARIGFTIEGQLQPDFVFSIVTLGGKEKECITANDGFYNLGPQKAGVVVNVCDTSSGKRFTFKIEDGKNEYLFDVTRMMRIVISATKDGAPICDAEIRLKLHDRDMCLTTDSRGVAVTEIPFFPGDLVSAKLEDHTLSEKAAWPEVRMEFTITSPVQETSELPEIPETPEKPETPDETVLPETVDNEEAECPDIPVYPVVAICMDQDGTPLPGHSLDIEYLDTEVVKAADAEGQIVLPDMPADAVVRVSDAEGMTHMRSFLITPGENILEFIIEIPAIQNSIKISGPDGKPFSDRKIRLIQGDTELILKLDSDGSAMFDDGIFEHGADIEVRTIPETSDDIPMSFTTSPDEREYVLEQVIESGKSWWRRLLDYTLLTLLLVVLSVIGIAYCEFLALDCPEWLPSDLWLWLYWMVNTLTFFLYAWDKRRAIFNKRRIPEAVLLTTAAVGGALGAFCAMLLFRHKIRKASFYITVPILLLLQLGVYAYLWYYYICVSP